MTATAPRGRDQSRLNFIDYVLMGLGSALAAYTAGMSIGRADTAQFLAMGVVLGTALSYFVRTLLGSTAVVKVDGILYAAAIVCAVIGFPVLNSLLPEEGFARDVMMAGVLAWMLVLGSVLTWRDGTLLFQAIPSVALFGLVGCYDTYASAPYMFFGFLVCLAIVLARANRREMMRQAVESGYFNRADAPSTPQDFPEQSPELYEDIRRGPWRWQAGPEWALASALAIVLLSRLGAPALQEAAKPITGAVRIMAPASVRRGPGRGGNFQETSYTVGRGPNRTLSERAIFEATLDRPRYLRTASYELYTGRGWSTDSRARGTGRGPVAESVNFALRAIGRSGQQVPFTVRPTEPTMQLPLPAEPRTLDSFGARIRDDGGGNLYRQSSGPVSGIAVVSNQSPTNAPRSLGEEAAVLFDTSLVTDRVKAFAIEAATGSTTDFEAVTAVARAIAGQVRYNINADAVPQTDDPADWFLFTNKEGYCDLFATAMTLSARSLGLPARYVVGFLPEAAMGDGAGHYVIREADYHAWCEVFFDNVGWVVFDATEGAEQVEGGERGSSDEDRPWYESDWVKNGARGFLALGAIGVGIYLVRGIRPKARPPRWGVHRAYAGFEKTIQRQLGRRRRPGETLEAFALAAESGLGGEVVTLGGRFARALYGPVDPSEAEVDALKAATKSLRPRRS
ncbi:transglutaminase domain-containing protein [bacterium]|nr:MAG: transglutaminase domain-containing protein [bacterium]